MFNQLPVKTPHPSTGDSDKAQSDWYKEMYSQMHKPPETKKDVILVKLPPTVSRYRDYYQQRGERQNPYTPTYTFPEEFNGNLQSMEDYIRRAATEHLDDETQYRPPSPVRASVLHVKDHPTSSKRAGEKVTRFEEHYSLPKTSSPPIDPIKSNNTVSSSTITVRTHPTANPPSSSTTDDEQKTVYKRILRGGDIPSSGLQKFVVHNRASSSQRPLILSNHSQSSTKLFAYYTVHWDQTQAHPSDLHPDGEMHFEINSCLYFQNDDGKDNEWEETRQDGSGYVVTYPPHLRPTNPLQIYNFDRSKDFLLTSDEIESLDGYALEDSRDAVD